MTDDSPALIVEGEFQVRLVLLDGCLEPPEGFEVTEILDLPGAEPEASQQQHAVGRPEVEPASADGQGETDHLEPDPTDTDFTLDDERTPS